MSVLFKPSKPLNASIRIIACIASFGETGTTTVELIPSYMSDNVFLGFGAKGQHD